MLNVSYGEAKDLLESFVGKECHYHNAAQMNEHFSISCQLGECWEDENAIILDFKKCKVANWPVDDTHLVGVLGDIDIGSDSIRLHTDKFWILVHCSEETAISRSTMEELVSNVIESFDEGSLPWQKK
jgi:hypothetical protein